MNSEELAWYIRHDGIEMTHKGNSSHIGSILSIADIIAVLYNDIMKYDAKNPQWDDRDRFILSKGHAGAAVYSVLARKGFFPVENLMQHCQNGSILSGHVSSIIDGVEISTGSLGHGLPISAGMALRAKMDNKDYHVFTILGDGECDEGSVWESALFCSQNKLNNLTVFIDHNQLQGVGDCREILNLDPLEDKWKAFGWNAVTINGHDHNQIRNALLKSITSKDKPNMIVANTIKGKGVSFMENKVEWHYKSPRDENYLKAIEELERLKP